MAAKLVIHPAFYRRVRHYRDRIAIHDSRPQVAKKFADAARELVLALLQNPRRGHSARFESADLSNILRVAVPGFPVFAIFYRWDGQTLTVITLEHTAQNLPSRLAGIVATPQEWRIRTDSPIHGTPILSGQRHRLVAFCLIGFRLAVAVSV